MKKNLFVIISVLLMISMVLCSCGGGGSSKRHRKHTLSLVEEVAATCDAPGNEAYYECSGCDKVFADEAGEVELDAIPTITASHNIEKTMVTDFSDEKYGYELLVCANCDYKEYGEDIRGKQYSYEPIISERLARIDIVTDDGTEDFATRWNRNDKIAGRIDYVGSKVSVSNCEEDYVLNELVCQVKVRGNYTLNYSKKPIRLKFDKKQKMLGLNDDQKFKSWVLLADWKDVSMQFNATAFYLGQQILGSDGYYCTDARNVEVYINNKYWGVYLLCEQQEAKEGRAGAPEADDDYLGTDIGYLFEYDGYYTEEDVTKGGDYSFTIPYNGTYNGRKQIRSSDGVLKNISTRGYTIKSDTYPAYPDTGTSAQRTFIAQYLETVYEIAYEAVMNNKYYKFNETYTGKVPSEETDQKKVIAAAIDIQSLADMYLLQDICCDDDLGWSSFYMSVDATATGNKLLTFEAPWDFDSAFGGKCVESGTGEFSGASGGNYDPNPWLILCSSCDWFKEMVGNKVKECVKYGVFDKALEHITARKTLYAANYAENNTKWNVRNGNPTGEFGSNFNGLTTEAACADRLTSWLTTRFNYLKGRYITAA